MSQWNQDGAGGSQDQDEVRKHQHLEERQRQRSQGRMPGRGGQEDNQERAGFWKSRQGENFKEGVQHCQEPQRQEKCWYMSTELSSEEVSLGVIVSVS